MKFKLLLVLLTPFLAFAQDLTKEVETNLQKRIQYGYSPSYTIGIVNKEGVRFYSYGVKSIDGTVVDEHTIYEIGSITKVFTGILLAQQIVSGNMKLDDPIKKYLPTKVRLIQRGDQEITLGNLSDHTSGLPRMPSNFQPSNPANPYADYTVEKMFAFLSGYELPRDVGSQYEYSNLAQGLLGYILAEQAGTSYESLMINTIAFPLGMKETKITLDPIMNNNLALGHSEGRVVENWDLTALAGAGAIRSSTFDLTKFLQANMGLLNTPLMEAMKLAQVVRHDKAGSNRVALGWHISKGKMGDVYWHNGGTGGYRTFLGFDKEKGVGVVVLSNSDKGVDDIGFHLLDPENPLKEPKASILPEMEKLIDSNRLDEAIALYQNKRLSEGEKYDFSEDVLNGFGYALLPTNLSAALAIFKLNMEQHPQSYNVHDSYGEALLMASIHHYKKSVEIYPGNTNGIEVLESLGQTVEFKEVKISESQMNTYVGVYQVPRGFKITITKVAEQLFLQVTGGRLSEIYPKNETEFYTKGTNAQIVFHMKEGKIEALTLFEPGRQFTAQKVD